MQFFDIGFDSFVGRDCAVDELKGRCMAQWVHYFFGVIDPFVIAALLAMSS